MRLIDGDEAIKDADYLYNLYVMAMANADTQKEINHILKRQELFKAVKAVIEHCPTVDTVKNGHWIDDGDCFICSNCRKAFGFLSKKCVTNYCPECGAKMGGEKE